MFQRQDRLAMDERHSANESPLEITENSLIKTSWNEEREDESRNHGQAAADVRAEPF